MGNVKSTNCARLVITCFSGDVKYIPCFELETGRKDNSLLGVGIGFFPPIDAYL